MSKRFRCCLLLGALCIGLIGCFAPEPLILRYRLQAPRATDQPHNLLVTLQNQGGGEGQAEITVHLRSQATGQTVAEASEDIDLKAHEIMTVTIPLQPSNPGPYTVVLAVHSPPQ